MKIKLYFIALLIFLVIDAVWLGLIVPGLYRSQIGHLMADAVNFPAAGLFYLLFVGGMVFFVIGPTVGHGEMRIVILRGALYGLVTYGTYDLTNFATLRDWTLLVTVVDLAWGTLLSAAVSALSVWTARKIL